ncbi:hypothetical protein [uncultured Chitinophaga sp.]|uniref:hypothetical protein n=1 Tax=uncultured Chitinophaga sp. TaxID=339340 RepID=UPI0025FA1C42|nr:hypothetical protein [uncultured Chitinophaga sp.]
MQQNKLDELKQQNEYWKDKLQLIETENIQFKNRLTKLLGNSIPKAQLDQLEYFFNKFFTLDEQLILLKHEIREQMQAIDKYPAITFDILKLLLVAQEKLEARIVIVHRNFGDLNREFSQYIKEKKDVQ